MKRKSFGKWISICLLAGAACLLSSLSSCARNQQLVGITIFPSGFTYGQSATPGATQTPIPLIAYGAYIHPPETKDITNSVIWSSDLESVANVDNTGGLTAGLGCGTANISASVYTDHGNPNGNVVVGFMNVTVDGPASDGCTPAGPQPILTIDFSGTGTGTVTGPDDISCSTPSTCSDQLPTGTTLNLTATATGSSTFSNWSGCSSTSGTNNSVCTVILENNVSATATFN